MKHRMITALLAPLALAFAISPAAQAADYLIDTKGAHAFVQFKIKHLGYSWLYGRFNDFDGTFSYDENDPSKAKVEVNIRTASIDSNHAERDKHLRDDEFLNVKKYPTAGFKSTAFEELGNGKAKLHGDFTLHGVTRNITIDVEHTGHGDDPWGGYRRGFAGSTTLKLADYNIERDLGPASREVEIILSIEGIRQ